MSQNLQNVAKFQKFQLENLVDFEKCCKTRIFLQKSVPIQPKRATFCRNFAKNWQLPYGSATACRRERRRARRQLLPEDALPPAGPPLTGVRG